MTANQTTFENENIQVNLKREPGCRISLDVVVTPQATKASYKKALDAIRKEVSVPGFRKGKAPDSMILQNYEKHVEKEWKDILLNTSLDEAIRLIKIFPFNNKSVRAASIKSSSQQDGSKLSFEYEAAPEIPDVAPESLTIPIVPLKQTTQNDVDAAIEELSLKSAEWSDVTDRPAQEGDFVLLDIDDIGENARNICTQQLFPLKKGKMGDWMLKLISGMTPGQTSEGMSEKENEEDDCNACEDGTHDHHHAEFVATLCRITLHTVRHAIPHALDDELAKKYGAASYDELKDRVNQSLEKRAAEEQKDQERRLMEHALLTNYPFDMPASLVQGELKELKRILIDDLRNQGVADADIPAEAKKIEQEAANKYERDFRLYFITQKYAKNHQIVVSQDDIMMEMMRQMWLKQMGQNTMDVSKDPKEFQSQLGMQMVAVKAIDQMIEKAGKSQKKA